MGCTKGWMSYLFEGHSIYARNKRFLDSENLSDSEQELVE